MNNFLSMILIAVILAIMFGFITISDCRDCSDNYTFKNYQTIQFYKSKKGLPVGTFTFCFNGKDTTKCHPNLK